MPAPAPLVPPTVDVPHLHDAMLAAYADGVNALIGAGTPLPVEYRLLHATPERWEPWHSIAVMRRLGLLMGSV